MSEVVVIELSMHVPAFRWPKSECHIVPEGREEVGRSCTDGKPGDYDCVPTSINKGS